MSGAQKVLRNLTVGCHYIIAAGSVDGGKTSYNLSANT